MPLVKQITFHPLLATPSAESPMSGWMALMTWDHRRGNTRATKGRSKQEGKFLCSVWQQGFSYCAHTHFNKHGLSCFTRSEKTHDCGRKSQISSTFQHVFLDSLPNFEKFCNDKQTWEKIKNPGQVEKKEHICMIYYIMCPHVNAGAFSGRLIKVKALSF